MTEEGGAMHKIVKDVKALLRKAGTAERRESAARFFKPDEKIKLHGLSSPDVRKISKNALAALKGMDKDQVFGLCGELWKSGYIEEAGIACDWAYAQRKAFAPDDMDVFEDWIDRYVTNWAFCDTLCNHSVGTLVEMYPGLIGRVKKWTKSENRWKKRAAAVTLIIPARRGLFLEDIFHIADRLLADPDHIVQKGYGWMLKAAGEAYPEEVFRYLMAKRDGMPRTAFRYALEKLPKGMRDEAMGK